MVNEIPAEEERRADKSCAHAPNVERFVSTSNGPPRQQNQRGGARVEAGVQSW
ncbi:hypothetical protein BRCON_2562 [Candidatus Sumerlaea chitinivorans]|uniref:Uncharacterized protein n=1 Tax=Sumerlaea chitinivorans TaxID=2250252 RepID=A0A2Z4Y7S4_SUMC1|nr:hypothetical protein BRCON_2562 [Candidatus Sumerlaea chitinivorans]